MNRMPSTTNHHDDATHMVSWTRRKTLATYYSLTTSAHSLPKPLRSSTDDEDFDTEPTPPGGSFMQANCSTSITPKICAPNLQYRSRNTDVIHIACMRRIHSDRSGISYLNTVPWKPWQQSIPRLWYASMICVVKSGQLSLRFKSS